MLPIFTLQVYLDISLGALLMWVPHSLHKSDQFHLKFYIGLQRLVEINKIVIFVPCGSVKYCNIHASSLYLSVSISQKSDVQIYRDLII